MKYAPLMLALATCTTVPEVFERPSFLIILADDLGFTDLGVLGSEIRTPNLDALARSGLLLTNFQVSPACSPTRAMLLAGTDSHPAGLGTMAGEASPEQEGEPGYEGHLSDRVVTVATLLRDAGYRTYMTGKWHLGGAPDQGPHARGFDRSFALLPGGASHFADATCIVEHGAPAAYREDGHEAELPADFYSSDFYTDKLIEYLDSGDGPFFAYAAYTAPHWPLQAPDDYLNRYRGAYDVGYDELRERRFEAARHAGIVPAGATVPERTPFAKAWSELTPADRAREARTMEIYAAMVENLDANVGRLIGALERRGELDDTLVLFLSDNGPEGNPVDQLSNNREWIPRRFDNSLDNMGRVNSYVYYGPAWAQAAVAPFRLFKTFPTAGGVRVPAIVRYGDHRAGQRSDAFATLKDVVPTVLELAGAAHPGDHYRGRDVAPLEGTSMWRFLAERSDAVHDDGAMCWELFGRRAVQRGRHKAVWLFEPYGPERWELFDVAADPAESRDLAAARPELLAELVALWDAYAQRHGVVLPARDSCYAIEGR